MMDRLKRTAVMALAGLILPTILAIGCRGKPRWEEYQGGMHLVLVPESTGDQVKDASNTTKIAEITTKRIEALGVR
jgi:hypothetical protein